MKKCIICNSQGWLKQKNDRSIWYFLAHGMEYANIMKMKESEK
jgi:hypothetical protein